MIEEHIEFLKSTSRLSCFYAVVIKFYLSSKISGLKYIYWALIKKKKKIDSYT